MEFLKDLWVKIQGFEHYILAFLLLLAGFVLGRIASYLIGHRFKKWAEKTKSQADDFFIRSVRRPVALFFQISGIYLAIKVLGLPQKPVHFENILDKCYSVFLAIVVTWLLTKFVDALRIHLEKAPEEEGFALDRQVSQLITKSLKVFLWVLAFIVTLQNLGYSVSGLLAGVGLGGLAVAMAAKDTLSNLFGSITVFLDKPFRIGDIVTLEGYTGTVEEIGFRSTRIRTFEDTLITIPNQKLTNAEVENLSARHWRKVKTTIGLTYDTSREKLKAIIQGIKNILKAHPKVADDFLVVFKNFGDNALEVFLMYKVTTTSYAEYLETQHEVNFQIMECVEKEGGEFAFPTRTVYLKQEDGKNGTGKTS